uniref:Uncharacterized protein n=1 Tax=Pseudomonas phage Cygsa01 TaxID=3138529 RepID=A0AAU6W3L1_9VIRU
MAVAVAKRKIHRLSVQYVQYTGVDERTFATFLFTGKLNETETLEFLEANLNMAYMDKDTIKWDEVAVYTRNPR